MEVERLNTAAEEEEGREVDELEEVRNSVEEEERSRKEKGEKNRANLLVDTAGTSSSSRNLSSARSTSNQSDVYGLGKFICFSLHQSVGRKEGRILSESLAKGQ